LRDGSVHDKKIYDESGLLHWLEYDDLHSDGQNIKRHHPVLFDAGYKGVEHTFTEAIVVSVRGIHKELSQEARDRNQRIGTDRIVVEHFFSRVKGHFRLFKSIFRSEKQRLEPTVFFAIALTNFLRKYRKIHGVPDFIRARDRKRKRGIKLRDTFSDRQHILNRAKKSIRMHTQMRHRHRNLRIRIHNKDHLNPLLTTIRE
jgi:hypothetical protein